MMQAFVFIYSETIHTLIVWMPNHTSRAAAIKSSYGMLTAASDALGTSSSSWCSVWPRATEMTVMMASAPKVPVNTAAFDCFSARSRAMKKVLSPISEKNMSRKPDTKPSRSGVSPTRPADVECMDGDVTARSSPISVGSWQL